MNDFTTVRLKQEVMDLLKKEREIYKKENLCNISLSGILYKILNERETELFDDEEISDFTEFDTTSQADFKKLNNELNGKV